MNSNSNQFEYFAITSNCEIAEICSYFHRDLLRKSAAKNPFIQYLQEFELVRSKWPLIRNKLDFVNERIPIGLQYRVCVWKDWWPE